MNAKLKQDFIATNMNETVCNYFALYMQSNIQYTGEIDRLLSKTKMKETECNYFSFLYYSSLQEESKAKKISSPLPAVGLYIAVASLVCLLFMLYDIYSGFRQRKRWVPCKLFALNSLTLTLLSIATKFPTDLTNDNSSYSSSRIGSLSKIFGIALVWASMNFFMPSLGGMTASQILSNMIALTILVITIAVDICIQLYTGAISLFFKIAILVILPFTLFSLLNLWISASEIRSERNIVCELNRGNLVSCKGSMIERLRRCYVRSYISNPQLLVCMNQYSFFQLITSAIFLYISLAIALVILPLDWEDSQMSNYKWSISVVSSVQAVAVMVTCLSNAWRCFMFKNNVDLRISINFLMAKVETVEVLHMVNNMTLSQCLQSATTKVLIIILSLRLKMKLYHWRARAAIWKCLRNCICRFVVGRATQESAQDPIIALHCKVEKWLVKKGEEDLKRWTNLNSKDCPNLTEFLSDARQSGEELSHYIQRRGCENSWRGVDNDYRVSCLSAVILVRLSSDLLQSTLDQSQMPGLGNMIKAFDEAFPILLFIDKNINALNFQKRRKLEFAERMWKYWDFRSSLIESDIGQVTYGVQSLLSTPIVKAQRESYFDFIRKEVDLMKSIIVLQIQSLDTDLYQCVKQLLVDMLHEFLTKLPIAVFKYVTDASPEDSEDKIKLAIIFLCQLKPLEDKIQWEFPSETDITNLVTPPGSSDYNHGSVRVPGSTAVVAPSTIESV